MYFAAKVLGQIFANPPYYILRCVVAGRDGSETLVVKGKIPGPVNRGSVFTFAGKYVNDKVGKRNLEITRSPLNPKHLEGSALTQWSEWASPNQEESITTLASLSDSGVPPAILNSLWREIERSPKAIKDNPWLLVYKGVSFSMADDIARTLLDEFNPHAKERVEASVFWSLLQGVFQGNCYLDSNTVFKDVLLLTGLSEPQEIANMIKGMVEATPSKVVVETTQKKTKALYLPSYHKMEEDVAALLTSPLRAEEEAPSEESIRSYSRYELTDSQVEAIVQGLTKPVSIVTGLPGTGKTTILNTLCKILTDRKESVLLLAPTGIAAKRASSITGLEAMTIHRAFGAGQPDEEKKENADYEGVKKDEESEPNKPSVGVSDPSKESWKFSPNNPRDERVVIVDEASMVDLHLMWRLLRGISPRCRVILVGDIAQLPPVGAGFVLSEIIDSQSIPRVHLEDVFRQGKDSEVTMAAHSIHRGEVPQSGVDFEFIETYSDQDTLDKIISLSRSLQMDEVDFHVMSPTHHGLVGVTNLNRELRAVLNPDLGGASLRVGSDYIRVGDRVMVTRNEYDLSVFNGDVGKVRNIDKASVEVLIKGVKDQVLDLPRDAVSKLLRLAYATTVHKSQGLEYHTIIMPMCSKHGQNLLKRSLIYTAVTRAKVKVLLIGDPNALSSSVFNDSTGCGFSRLAEKISQLK